jgi:NADP-reducing hydrogenase subunit HndC
MRPLPRRLAADAQDPDPNYRRERKRRRHRTLEDLAETAKGAALCALGKSAPNPFLSTLRYFRNEYEAHINEKKCPALSCKELIAYHIDPEKCKACMICGRKCPADAIDGGKNKIHMIDQDKCTKCGTCFEVCPPRFGAVQKISGEPVPDPIPEEERIIRKRKEKMSESFYRLTEKK